MEKVNNETYKTVGIAIPGDELRKCVLNFGISEKECEEYLNIIGFSEIDNKNFCNKIYHPTEDDLKLEQEYYIQIQEKHGIDLRQEPFQKYLMNMKIFKDMKAFFEEKIKNKITDNGEF